jgi:CxxC motif-containing protein
MTRELVCIECPVGCTLSVDWQGCAVTGVSGNKCPRGEKYAVEEIQNPMRILTSAVVCEGLSLKMLPVRTDRPIPKARLTDAMRAVRAMRLRRPVRSGETIAANFLNLGVDLIATRDST